MKIASAQKTVMSTPREDLAWAAGFFEGEGCFYAHKGPKRQDGTQRMSAAANCTQKDREVLQRFQRIIGFGWLNSGNDRGVSAWGTHDVSGLIGLIGEWLSERRLHTAAQLLAQQAEQVDRRTLGSWNKGGTSWNKGLPWPHNMEPRGAL